MESFCFDLDEESLPLVLHGKARGLHSWIPQGCRYLGLGGELSEPLVGRWISVRIGKVLVSTADFMAR